MRLLVANRGEIACRVLAAARGLGLETVAVYSDADAGAPHVAMADQAVHIGPAAVGRSYLEPQRILDAAQRTGATAIHPGYGFLSENAGFARAVLEAGLTWVGPPPEAIAAMGDKAAAKDRMRQAGVPVVPGAEGDPDHLRSAAAGIGYPLLVKAAAGGGGRGMRRVDRAEDLDGALASAATEAAHAFGSDELLLERLLEDARHVEIQVLADGHGHTVHLGERDCSVQRRHQKVIEEAPSPAVDEELRQAMGEAAVAAARAVAYVGAGTVEFLLARDRSFYFLEMNTRLQVEHPVTEQVWGIDLVQWQLRIAMGQILDLHQQHLAPEGHAIEARIYAEDPHQDYLPQLGSVLAFAEPADHGLRFDHAVQAGRAVTADYDPMLGKLIAWGRDRQEALRLLNRGLAELVLLGIGSNRQWLRQVLAHPTFAQGEATTAFLDQVRIERPAVSSETLAATAALWLDALGAGRSPLRTAHPFEQPLELSIGGERQTIHVSYPAPFRVRIGDRQHTVQLLPGPPPERRVRIDGTERPVHAIASQGRLYLAHALDHLVAEAWAPSAASGPGDGSARAPTSGRIVRVSVTQGDRVEAGQILVLLEAMKLETPVKAAIAGTVAELRCEAGQVVKTGQVLVRIEALESP